MPTARPARKSARRRSFSQQNLAERHEGPLGPLLAEALRVPPDSGYVLTHAFHPYPGRFHPHLPRTLLAGGTASVSGTEPASAPLPGLGNPGQRVLDPFMGGGTTLVEALLAGLSAVGNDLNPVALLVARERTRPRTATQAAAVDSEARRIAGQVEALRREKRSPRYALPALKRVAPHHAPHLLAELMQWIRILDGLPEGPTRETLRAVFSSAVVKYSNQAADSTPDAEARPSVPKGSVSRFLVLKCEELLRAQLALGRRLAPTAAPVTLLQEDARLLPSLGWGEADLVITSPPYPGTYDYHGQHRLRMDWLSLPGTPLQEGELAPRRAGPSRTLSADLRDVLVTLARVLKPGAPLLIVLGDWMDGDHAVDGAAQLRRAAQDKGWRCDSWASLARTPHSRAERKVYSRRGKWEHLLLFRRP